MTKQKDEDYNKSLRHENSVSENPRSIEITNIRGEF